MADETASVLGKRKAGSTTSTAELATIPLERSKISKKLKASRTETPENGNQSSGQNTQSVSPVEHLNASGHGTGESNSEDEAHEDESYNEDEDDFDEDDLFEDSLDEDDPEYEVEEHDHIVPGEPERVVKLRLHISREEPFEDWLDNFHISCTYNNKDIGYAFGRYIYRERIRADFWTNMEEPSQDMSNVAFEIFDRYGYLKRNLREHCVQKGTGVWGSELDFGPLFLIEQIQITDRGWRRMGLGRAMVNALIQKAQVQMKPQLASTPEDALFLEMFAGPQDPKSYLNLHTLVLPGWLRSDVKAEWEGKSNREQRNINHQAIDVAFAFHRSLGFRRIGASSCFGFSSDPDHKSHTVPITEDFDPRTESIEEEVSDCSEDEDKETPMVYMTAAERKEEKRLDGLKQKLPLHHATITLRDADCVEFYKAFQPKDEAEWKQVDRSHNTILHVAACQLKPQSVKWLVENVNSGKCLSSTRNLKGYTPLESLQDQLETRRTQWEPNLMKIDISDDFRGFLPQAVECLSLLLHGSASKDLPEIERLQLTYGCTCGECLGGFLSPRLKLALLFQAEAIPDSLDMFIEDGPLWCQWHKDVITHVPVDLQRNFSTNKSLRQGFSNIFTYIAACLRSNVAPTKISVLAEFQDNGSEWPPVTRNYLERGRTLEGKVESAIRAVFDCAQEQDERTGDGMFDVAMKADLAQLKACRNDYEFEFVAHNLIS